MSYTSLRTSSKYRLRPGPKIGGKDLNRVEHLTAIIEREGDGYVSLCPELDIASQGDTIEGARRNLQEALELFFETAEPSEVKRRLRTEVYVTRLEVSVG
jgi:predicted RNase H-like HicB family nuclease